MATYQSNGANGINGVNGVHGVSKDFPPPRFSGVPQNLSVTLNEPGEEAYDIEIPLDMEIPDDPTEICTLLDKERSSKSEWMTVAIAYAKYNKVEVAIEVMAKAMANFASSRSEDRLSILNAQCWLYLLKCREAPRIRPDGSSDDVRTKDYYLQAATGVLNEASRINPSYPPLYLARGILYLLRASLLPPPTTAGSSQVSAERMEVLKQASKCFDDALRASGQKNLMARLGKARVAYSMARYQEALKQYQAVLENSPSLIDPDPRIGIGCCFWQLGHKEEAAGAWERSLQLNSSSKVALLLLGLYKLYRAGQFPPMDPKFIQHTKEALNLYINPAMQLDKMYPLTCATLGSWFVLRKQGDVVETLSRRAINLTDVNDIASDGWYHLARKEHQANNTAKALDYYTKADRARGGDERGYVPAKFGLAQIRVLMHDYDGAKFRLEKILQQQPTVEAQILLGSLYAEDVFAAQASNSKDDKSNELKKALKYLEDVTKAWRDPKKKLSPDRSVLLILARLYETEHPEKSLKCLEEVERLELEAIPEEDYPQGIEDEAQRKAELREMIPPQLLNNMGCFHYQSERYVQARELFQHALNACVKAAARDNTLDTDALVTSISYNLGRTYESEGMINEAKDVYNNLLKRHADYIHARVRLAFLTLQQYPTNEGPKAVYKLYQDHKDDLEVRSLYGWYLNKSKKRVENIAEDQEQRHHKHTLQGNNGANKHDQYALTGLGNIHLTAAREMRGPSEQEKDKRRKAYEKSAEFFDKVLQVDGRNAYAAQGIAIALIEDKKDLQTGLQILNKVKETLKDYSVFMNLGHTYCELKQYSRAIENYEAALSRAKPNDVTLLACLGRVWLLRGKTERSLTAMKTSLDYSQRALEVHPDQVHFQFNVAFVQMQIAQLVITLKDSERTLAEVDQAIEGLEAAITSFSAIAKSPQPPFPGHDIEQRASMGRNTMRKQLDRARESQHKYEQANASKLEQARLLREAEQRRQEEEKRAAEEREAERRRKILEEQQRLREKDQEIMAMRMEEERRRQELIDDSNLAKAERKRKGGKRKKKDDDESESEAGGSDSEGGRERSRRRRTTASASVGLTDGDEEKPKSKKRKLERRKKEPVGKYKSSEMVVDSDEELADEPATEDNAPTRATESDDEVVAAPRVRKAARVVDDDEDEDDVGGGAVAQSTEVMDEDEDE
ncbi:TPR-like protein [Sporormia fimetaria CBS 119925]|uniref:TPR-like protein n=1 Tax=Sporormia fimetaria CBS 119925 TaxID=1340428 RepID=A0A6A6VIM5_9PLEO|nr:TPR-like protein [Sporormia fimetaria CBS 119925]